MTIRVVKSETEHPISDVQVLFQSTGTPNARLHYTDMNGLVRFYISDCDYSQNFLVEVKHDLYHDSFRQFPDFDETQASFIRMEMRPKVSKNADLSARDNKRRGYE